MQRRRLVARLAWRWRRCAPLIRIVAGTGNNGGDGIDAAIRLQHAGAGGGGPRSAPAVDDARDALARARCLACRFVPDASHGPGRRISPSTHCSGWRAPRGRGRPVAIAALNALPGPVLAIDLPSGLAADTGQPWARRCHPGAVDAQPADARSPASSPQPGATAGTVWFDDLGIDIARRADRLARRRGDGRGTARATPAQGQLRRRRRGRRCAGHGRRRCWPAAPRLAAGAGACSSRCSMHRRRARPGPAELMLRPGWSRHVDPATLANQHRGVRLRRRRGGAHRLPALLSNAVAWCSTPMRSTPSPPTNRCAASCAPARRGATHGADAASARGARLLACSNAAIQADRLAAAPPSFADRFACVVVLKGSGSVVAAPGPRALHQRQRRCFAGHAGTGDVLAGWLGGHWAQATRPMRGERAWPRLAMRPVAGAAARRPRWPLPRRPT